MFEQPAVAGLALFQFLEGPYLLVDIQHRTEDGRPPLIDKALAPDFYPDLTSIFTSSSKPITNRFFFTNNATSDVFDHQRTIFLCDNYGHR